jgi:hypothetical protein
MREVAGAVIASAQEKPAQEKSDKPADVSGQTAEKPAG